MFFISEDNQCKLLASMMSTMYDIFQLSSNVVRFSLCFRFEFHNQQQQQRQPKKNQRFLKFFFSFFKKLLPFHNLLQPRTLHIEVYDNNIYSEGLVTSIKSSFFISSSILQHQHYHQYRD